MLKSDSFRGKTILITGGGTGLGRTMGKYLLQLGANLVISSRKKEVIDKTASELIAETGGKVLAIVCDIRKYEEIENVIKSAEKEFGRYMEYLITQQEISSAPQKDYRIALLILSWTSF